MLTSHMLQTLISHSSQLFALHVQVVKTPNIYPAILRQLRQTLYFQTLIIRLSSTRSEAKL